MYRVPSLTTVEHVQVGETMLCPPRQTGGRAALAGFGRSYSATKLRYLRIFTRLYPERARTASAARGFITTHVMNRSIDAKHHKRVDVSATLAAALEPRSRGFSDR